MKETEFSWKPLSSKWRTVLMSDAFVEKDCLGDGNCQFRSIETALTDSGYKTDHVKLRKVIAKYIKNCPMPDFENIIMSYRAEKEAGEFIGKWDPFAIGSKKDFTKQIMTPGMHFEGDNVTLSLLSKAIGIDFVLLDNAYNITNLSNPDNLHDNLIILHYKSFGGTGHYTTIGWKSPRGKVHTIFKRIKLPTDVAKILDPHTMFFEHAKAAYNGVLPKVTVNGFVKALEERLSKHLTVSQKRKAFSILNTLLQNDKFFQKSKN